MADNNKKIDLYVLTTALYAEDSPVLVYAGALVMDRFSEKVFVTLRLRNLDEREVIAAAVYIQPYGPWGEPYPQEVIYRYNSLKAAHDQEFGGKKLIPMPDNNVRSFQVFISEVTFADYSTWKNEKPFEPVGRANSLREGLGGDEAAKMFTARYGSDACFMPLLEKEIWYCTCGAINRNDKEKCYNCRRNRDAFQKVNYETLKADARKRADAEKLEEAKAQKKKKDRGRLLLKIAMVILPILLAAALIFSTVPPFLARREAYSNAQTLLSAGKYEEAQEMFAQLGDYLDAKELAEKGVQYQKAMAVFEGAKKADPSVLPLVGLTRNDVADTEDLSMLLYAKAKELLEPLGNYQAAEESVKQINVAFEEYEEQKILGRYNEAVRLLEEGEYLGARDAFLALGTYKDSVEMAKEALYRRASEALAFCEENKTRGIFVFPSDDKTVKSQVSMPGHVLTALGSDNVYQLKQCFVKDGVEFAYEDTPSQNGLLPVCDAVAAEFDALGEYKDSRDLAARARAAGDYTDEFYQFLADGELEKAHQWLQDYDDPIPNRENYADWIVTYYSYCRRWKLTGGDALLIPYSAGNTDDKFLVEFSPRITIAGDEVTMHLGDDAGTYSVELKAELGSTEFTYQPDDATYFTVLINPVNNHFLYSYRYISGDLEITVCEYEPAE